MREWIDLINETLRIGLLALALTAIACLGLFLAALMWGCR